MQETLKELLEVNKQQLEMLNKLVNDKDTKQLRAAKEVQQLSDKQIAASDLEVVKAEISKYECYAAALNDNEFMESVLNIMSNEYITLEQLKHTLKNVSEQSKRATIKDIKKYTYSCLHKINRH